MKHTLFSILLVYIIFPSLLLCQDGSDLQVSQTGYIGIAPFSSWMYNYSDGWAGTGYHFLEFGQDTIVNNRQALVLNRTQEYVDQREKWNRKSRERSPIIFFESPGLVEILIGSEFDTLYHFDGEIGSSWTNIVSNDVVLEAITIVHTIVDKGQLSLNDTEYDFIKMKYDFLNFDGSYIEAYYQDTIAIGIGNIRGYILPWHSPANFVDVADGGRFRCFYNDGDLVYQKDPAVACDFVVSSKDVDFQATFDIYPNPVNETLFIQKEDQNEKVTYSIFSIQGKLMHQSDLPSDGQLDLSTYTPGLYYLSLRSEDARLLNIKILVNR